MIIAICGLIGSGKGTVADILVNKFDFAKVSFADSLKDAVSGIFNWPRHLLEGDTEDSRNWREQVDTWWADRLDIPHLTPRWVLQQWGTDVARKTFHDDIWVASIQNKLRHLHKNIVIPDCRFPNEIKTVKQLGGQVWTVARGTRPEWYQTALKENTSGIENHWMLCDRRELMEQKYPKIHYSEWAWIGQNFDYEIENNGSLEDLNNKIRSLIAR